ncbi:hypothetical protein EDC01DRAFT_630586 [Geopyxis carbonaria]|nr:hypothetical protein EDC01DRAFT_630586 [Geopyxis carbonaria]
MDTKGMTFPEVDELEEFQQAFYQRGFVPEVEENHQGYYHDGNGFVPAQAGQPSTSAYSSGGVIDGFRVPDVPIDPALLVETPYESVGNAAEDFEWSANDQCKFLSVAHLKMMILTQLAFSNDWNPEGFNSGFEALNTSLDQSVCNTLYYPESQYEPVDQYGPVQYGPADQYGPVDQYGAAMYEPGPSAAAEYEQQGTFDPSGTAKIGKRHVRFQFTHEPCPDWRLAANASFSEYPEEAEEGGHVPGPVRNRSRTIAVRGARKTPYTPPVRPRERAITMGLGAMAAAPDFMSPARPDFFRAAQDAGLRDIAAARARLNASQGSLNAAQGPLRAAQGPPRAAQDHTGAAPYYPDAAQDHHDAAQDYHDAAQDYHDAAQDYHDADQAQDHVQAAEETVILEGGSAPKQGPGFVRLYDGSGMFQCEYCGNKYMTQQSARRHVPIHTAVRVACPICGAGPYYTNKRMRDHIDRMHPDVDRNDPEIRKAVLALYRRKTDAEWWFQDGCSDKTRHIYRKKQVVTAIRTKYEETDDDADDGKWDANPDPFAGGRDHEAFC